MPEVLSACPQPAFKDYLDTTCAHDDWEELLGKTLSARDKRSSHLLQYLDIASAAGVAGPSESRALFLCDNHPFSRLLRNRRQRIELLRLRIGAGSLRAQQVHIVDGKPLPLHQRTCLKCCDGSVDDLPHLFFSCSRTMFSRASAREALSKVDALCAWDRLSQLQLLSLLLLFTTPDTYYLPNPEAVQATIGQWLTAALDSLISTSHSTD